MYNNFLRSGYFQYSQMFILFAAVDADNSGEVLKTVLNNGEYQVSLSLRLILVNPSILYTVWLSF